MSKYLALLFFLSVSALASWTVTEKSDRFIAQSSEFPNFEIPLRSVGGNPEVLKWEKAPQGKKIFVLHYSAGQAGTSNLYQVERAVVVDIKKRKVLGDAPQKYQAIGSAPQVEQPTWEWQTHKLKVSDPEKGEDLELRW